MSTEHDVQVVKIGLIRKHPDADALGVVDVYGRPCVVRLEDWKSGDLAVYVPVDSMVPVADPRFAFLDRPGSPVDGYVRVRALRLRGIFSMGLLVRPTVCGQCEGSGRDPWGLAPLDPCTACDGSGSAFEEGDVRPEDQALRAPTARRPGRRA